MFGSERLRSCCTYTAAGTQVTTSSKTTHSILDIATLILGVDALFEYVVTDFGETWLLLRLPRYDFTFDLNLIRF